MWWSKSARVISTSSKSLRLARYYWSRERLLKWHQPNTLYRLCVRRRRRSISRKHHQLELPNFGQRRSSASLLLRLRFSILSAASGVEFSGWFCEKKNRDGMEQAICDVDAWCSLDAPHRTDPACIWTGCTFRVSLQPLPSSFATHLHVSLPNRATFCRSACVFAVIAILLRTQHMHIASSIAHTSHSRVRECCAKKPATRRRDPPPLQWRLDGYMAKKGITTRWRWWSAALTWKVHQHRSRTAERCFFFGECENRSEFNWTEKSSRCTIRKARLIFLEKRKLKSPLPIIVNARRLFTSLDWELFFFLLFLIDNFTSSWAICKITPRCSFRCSVVPITHLNPCLTSWPGVCCWHEVSFFRCMLFHSQRDNFLFWAGKSPVIGEDS